jgi:ABC-type sulfate transport system permease component
MSGEKLSRDRLEYPPGRTANLLFTAFFYTAVIALVLASCWLFLSNAGELFPKKLADIVEMDLWRKANRAGEFAGGLWKDAAFWRSVNLSILTSTLAALIAAIVGIPAAYALSRFKIPGRSVIDVLFSSVIVLPASSVGLCLIVVFQYGFLHKIQTILHMQVAHSIFPGIIVAQLVLSLALGLSAWKAAFDGVNPRFELVARTLGSSNWRAFWTVTFPLSRTGLLAGFILAWARAMAEFGAVLLFCGTFSELPLSRFSPLLQTLQLHKADILPVAMWTAIEYGELEYGFGIAFALVAISGISIYTMHRLGGKGYVW